MPHRETRRSTGLTTALSRRVLSALSYPHPVASYAEVLNPRLRRRTSSGHVPATVVAVQRPTADSVTLAIRPLSRWRGFKPGQFIELVVDVDGVRRVRCFSPAQSVHVDDGLIELTIKANADGEVSRYLYDHAHQGMMLAVSPPQGAFHLPEHRPERIVLISGGSGITPVLAMLRTLVDEAHAGRISFVHYARRPSDVIAGEELQAIATAHANIDVLIVYTAADARDQGAGNGHCSAAQLAALVPDLAAAQTWLCGPTGLMEAVGSVFEQNGWSEQLHQERFGLAVKPVDVAASGDVQFARSERFVANTGATLLEQAEAAGLRPQHGCRMGICSPCTCRKTAGVVRNLQTGELSSESDEQIRICISQPVGSVTLEL